MKTETYLIDRLADTPVVLAENTVAKIMQTDGRAFVGNAYMTEQDGALVVAYADGTSVSLTF